MLNTMSALNLPVYLNSGTVLKLAKQLQTPHAINSFQRMEKCIKDSNHHINRDHYVTCHQMDEIVQNGPFTLKYRPRHDPSSFLK